MSNEIEDVKEEINKVKKDHINAYELAISTIDTNYKREKFVVKCLLAIIGVLLAINGFMAYEIATTTILETTEQEGIYNFYDSEGNIVSTDLS